jgi:hypothetical protein
MRTEPAARDDDTNELFGQLSEALRREVGARARLRALSTRVRIGAVLGVASASFLVHLAFLRRPDFSHYSAQTFWMTSALLAAVATAGTVPLLRGVSAPSKRGLPVALWLAPVLMAVLVPLVAADGAWGSPLACFVYGTACTAPLVLLLELFERRDHVPLATRLAAGALAGVVANLLLHARCPSSHFGHLLLGHASVGFAWSLLLGCWCSRAGSR